MQKFQEVNPNNSKVSIDFNKVNPVSFVYVGNKSAFSIGFNLFRRIIFVQGILPSIFFSGMFITFYLLTHNYFYWFMSFFLFTFMVYLLPAILSLIFISNKKLLKLFPYIQTLYKTKFYAEFKPDNVKDNKIEIPLYSNVYLNYKLSDDFSNQIDKIEVTEHPFNIITFKIGFLNRKKQLKPNEYLWKCTFYFKQTPVNGSLKVIFI